MVVTAQPHLEKYIFKKPIKQIASKCLPIILKYSKKINPNLETYSSNWDQIPQGSGKKIREIFETTIYKVSSY